MLTVLRISLQMCFLRADPLSPKWGHEQKKLKVAYCTEHYFKQLLFFNAFQNISPFSYINDRNFEFLAP
jgi:hypothetical protein